MAVRASRPSCLKKILERLIGFPTVSDRSNLDLIQWAADFLEAAGARVVVLPSGNQPKANLFASIGPDDIGGVLLSAHADVVPADAAEWSADPFRLREKDGRYYGRGTTDMKGFIACILHLLDRVDSECLQVPIHIALSYDEELGCLGVPELVAEFGGRLPKPAVAIVGEPSGMSPVTMHRGYRVFRSEIRGTPAHAGEPYRGVSAIRIASAFLAALQEVAGEIARESASLTDKSMATTINVGCISGGTAVNIVPSSCTIDWEVRMRGAEAVARIRERLAALLRQTLPEDLLAVNAMERISTFQVAEEPQFAGNGSAAISVVRECQLAAGGGSYPFGTEAGFFQKAGVPSVILGPGYPEQAHIGDEFIEADQLDQCMAFLERLAELLRQRDRFERILEKNLR